MIITAGKFKGQNVTAPDENITRPTLSKVRMGIFNTLQSMVDFESCSFLDMYAGSGIMGLEALSRGFLYVLEIEKNPKAFKIVKSNFEKINSPSNVKEASLRGTLVTRQSNLYKILSGDSLKVAPKLQEKYDVIYIDPPYFSGIYEQSLQAVKSVANNIIILEHVADVDFSPFEIIKQKKYGDKFITFLSK